ncbi:MAG TPA: lysylphosphatidylglycerol synthase domain-containing protein, partial [Trueperaceae bacterium]|nr:lysylphosphatidylglycerol synthase domain-containing protein [Trueperaceae bacterium]
MKRTPRPWQALALALLLGLAGLTTVTLWLGEPSDLRQLLRLPLRALCGALLLLLASFLAGGARLVVMVRLAGARVNLWRATRSYVLGLFAAAVTPSGGGNGIAIGVSLQRYGVGANVAWSAAVYSAVLDLLFYAWAIPLAAFQLFRADLLTHQLFWLALAMAAICFALWYGLAFHLRVLRHVLVLVVSVPLLKRWRRRVLRLFDDVGAAT